MRKIRFKVGWFYAKDLEGMDLKYSGVVDEVERNPRVKLVTDNSYDFFILVESPRWGENFVPERTILFQYEPERIRGRLPLAVSLDYSVLLGDIEN